MATEQTWQALHLANDIRTKQQAIKRAVKAGERTVAEVLADVPECCANMRLEALLRAQYRWGTKRALTFCRHCGVPPHRKLGDLTARQRRALIEEL